MKGLRAGILVLVLVWQTQCQARLSEGVSCPNNNPFIKQIPAGAVALNKEPQLETKICGFEFGKYGSCCDTSQLVEFGVQEFKQLTLETERVNREYAQFQELLPKIHKLFKQIAFAPLHPSNADWNRKITEARSQWVKTNQLSTLASYLVSKDHARRFFESNQKCWNIHARAREVALCYTCSGRSSHFFREGKALINQSTCDLFVEHCYFPLSEMAKLLQRLQLIFHFGKSAQIVGLSLNGEQKINTADLYRYSNQLYSQRLDVLTHKVTTQNMHPNLKQVVCNQFLRLREKPLVSSLYTMFTADIPWVVAAPGLDAWLQENDHHIKVAIAAYDAQQASKISNKAAGVQQPVSNWNLSRLLQFGSASSLIGSDAKIISPSDPSYTSVGVSGNSPMDLGNSFP